MKRRQALAILALTVGIALAGCSKQYPTYSYKMTVEVDTPEGLRTGSSVIEVRTHEGYAFPGPEAATIRSRLRGEAVMVDLGERGTLFALLRSENGQTGGYAWALLPNPPTRGEDFEARRANYEALESVRDRVALPRDMYPMLVRFRNVLNPLTVEQVDPGNLARSLGAGVRLRNIFVEITDESTTGGIQQVLPWLGTSVVGYLDGQKTGGGPQLSNILDTTAFKRGG